MEHVQKKTCVVSAILEVGFKILLCSLYTSPSNGFFLFQIESLKFLYMEVFRLSFDIKKKLIFSMRIAISNIADIYTQI